MSHFHYDTNFLSISFTTLLPSPAHYRFAALKENIYVALGVLYDILFNYFFDMTSTLHR